MEKDILNELKSEFTKLFNENGKEIMNYIKENKEFVMLPLLYKDSVGKVNFGKRSYFCKEYLCLVDNEILTSTSKKGICIPYGVVFTIASYEDIEAVKKFDDEINTYIRDSLISLVSDVNWNLQDFNHVIHLTPKD